MNEFTKDLLRVKVYPTTEEMGLAAAKDVADKIVELLSKKEEINMIFAAAPSQSAFLEALIADDRIEWNGINAFHMDEYIGIDFSRPQSFANFLSRSIFSKVPLKSRNYINGAAENPQEECNRYARLLEKFSVDIVCLGIGENGHIAFNDPDVALFDDPQMVKIVAMDSVCRGQQVKEGCFPTLGDVPKQAVTLTVPALLRADWMFCIVPFVHKAPAVKKMLEGEISESCPASILRRKENSCLYLNKDSSSLL